MASSSYYFNVISHTKDIDQFTDGEIEKEYKPFIINKMVSEYPDLVIFAAEMNKRTTIPKKAQLKFYATMIPKKKRRALWSNKHKDINRNVVMEYYAINQTRADEYLKILTTEQISDLKNKLNKGGKD